MKSKTTILASASIPIYRQRIRLMVVESDLPGEVKRVFSTDGVDESNAAVTLCRGGDISVCFIRGLVSHRNIAHEVYHAVNDVMRYVSVRHDRTEHEADAYLCGWITDWVYSQLKKHGVEIK